jgi:hypothetical protein
MKVVKRLKFSEYIIKNYRDYFSQISFQKFVENAVENEIRRKHKKRLRSPF